MKYRYAKYAGGELDDLDFDDLVSKLSDLLLSSGFANPHFPDDDLTVQALHDAILEALLNGGTLSDEAVERLLGDSADDDRRSALEDLIQAIIDRMAREGFISMPPGTDGGRLVSQRGPGGRGSNHPPATFEVTDKALDFLGYRALRDLLGALGKRSDGRHDTRAQAPGIDAAAAPKPFEFGDMMNLDAPSTLLNAIGRGAREVSVTRQESSVASDQSSLVTRESRARTPEAESLRSRPRGSEAAGASGGGAPRAIDVSYEDLMVVQGDYQSSCSTVLLLDCSHSMILYGEDRFTPAKRVALALAHLIRTQYPGDSLHAVLFHDSAEEVPVAQLGRVRVGPYYTNTREGLRLARRILDRERKDMRQIVMITDGKPSALTQPDGRIYKNAFGLDPLIVAETCAEVAACRRDGILINTFMLARDGDLVAFVRRVAEICRGKAYFTTPVTLGEYVLMDYLNKKTKTVH